MTFILAVILLTGFMFLVASTGINSTLGALITVFVPPAALGGVIWLKAKINDKNWEKLNGAVKLDYEKGVLHLRARSGAIRPLVSFEKVTHNTMAHKDSEYIYTSVTVGGITTGGISKTKEYDYVQSTQDLGLYKFLFDGHDISKIYLTDELYRQAKKSYIAKYLNEEEKSIRLNNDMQISQELQSMGVFSLAFRNELTLAHQQTYPSKTRCDQVLAWICGSDQF